MKKTTTTKNQSNEVIEYHFFKHKINGQFVGYKMVKLDDIFPRPKYGRY